MAAHQWKKAGRDDVTGFGEEEIWECQKCGCRRPAFMPGYPPMEFVGSDIIPHPDCEEMTCMEIMKS
jgi:hypothetical protein